MQLHLGSLSLAALAATIACSGAEDANRGPRSAEAGANGDSPPPVEAPAQPMSESRGTVPMKITGQVNGEEYRASGTGECASSADASIYEMPATLWHAIFTGPDGDDPRHLNLTVWRPRAGGADMVGLSLQTGETTHTISTVKGGQMAGSGTAGMRPAGKGGILTVSGKDDHGHGLELSVECERFDEVIAEGG